MEETLEQEALRLYTAYYCAVTPAYWEQIKKLWMGDIEWLRARYKEKYGKSHYLLYTPAVQKTPLQIADKAPPKIEEIDPNEHMFVQVTK